MSTRWFAAILLWASAASLDAQEPFHSPILLTAAEPGVATVLPNSEADFPALLAVPAAPVKGRKACKSGCPTDYNPNYAYLPDQNPDCRRHPHHHAGGESNCATCGIGWIGGSYLFAGMSDLGEVKRGVSHGLTLNGGLWLDSAHQSSIQWGGLLVTDSFSRSLTNAEVTSFAGVYSGDLSLRHQLHDFGHVRIDGLLGYRYLQIFEKFRTQNINDIEWKSWNNVHLGQIGLGMDWRMGPYSTEIMGRVGFGINEQTGKRAGTLIFNDSPFVIVPELNAIFGYQLGEGIRGTIGYQLMYLNDAVRPANRDVGQFYLHGITAGLEWRF